MWTTRRRRETTTTTRLVGVGGTWGGVQRTTRRTIHLACAAQGALAGPACQHAWQPPTYLLPPSAAAAALEADAKLDAFLHQVAKMYEADTGATVSTGRQAVCFELLGCVSRVPLAPNPALLHTPCVHPTCRPPSSLPCPHPTSAAAGFCQEGRRGDARGPGRGHPRRVAARRTGSGWPHAQPRAGRLKGGATCLLAAAAPAAVLPLFPLPEKGRPIAVGTLSCSPVAPTLHPCRMPPSPRRCATSWPCWRRTAAAWWCHAPRPRRRQPLSR